MKPGITLRNLTKTQQRFLKAYSTCASITRAAKAAAIERQNHYDWLESDADYQKAFPLVQERAGQALEDAAVERAMVGVKRAIRHKGRVVGHQQEFSDTLLLALLKRFRPELYRDRTDSRVTMGFTAEAVAEYANTVEGDPDDHD